MKKIKYPLLVILIIAISFGFYYTKRADSHDPHYIPAFTIDSDEDMNLIIVYENRIYPKIYGYKLDVDIDDQILGTYLGSITPSIDEYTHIEKNDIYLAGNMFANIYRVNGYAEEFRLCTYDRENNMVYFYENLNGILVESGNDIFIERLCFDTLFPWNIISIHSYPKYDKNASNIIPDLSNEDITSLYNALISSEHILYEDISQTIEVICTLSVQMKDNTKVAIHFYTGNYIAYDTVYFIMNDPIYNKIISLYL